MKNMKQIILFRWKIIFLLEYDRIDISERIDINKTNASKECDICDYLFFLSKNFNLETYQNFFCFTGMYIFSYWNLSWQNVGIFPH